MYNQYISSPREEVHKERREPPEQKPQPPREEHHEASSQAVSAFGNLSHLLSGRMGKVRFDADMLIALAVIWFLVSDGGELDTELLLMIGILLFLGI